MALKKTLSPLSILRKRLRSLISLSLRLRNRLRSLIVMALKKALSPLSIFPLSPFAPFPSFHLSPLSTLFEEKVKVSHRIQVMALKKTLSPLSIGGDVVAVYLILTKTQVCGCIYADWRGLRRHRVASASGCIGLPRGATGCHKSLRGVLQLGRGCVSLVEVA